MSSDQPLRAAMAGLARRNLCSKVTASENEPLNGFFIPASGWTTTKPDGGQSIRLRNRGMSGSVLQREALTQACGAFPERVVPAVVFFFGLGRGEAGDDKAALASAFDSVSHGIELVR